MALTSGFYNSLNGDRKYDSPQMSELFSGILNDGVFINIGSAFKVTQNSGNIVNIGTGRGWAINKWFNNDAIVAITLEQSEILLDRIDTVVIQIEPETLRSATFKTIKGTPAVTPIAPTLSKTSTLYQLPLADIRRVKNSTSITTANITNLMGTTRCPYITGILQVLNNDNLIGQWAAKLQEWYNAENSNWHKWSDDKKDDIIAWLFGRQQDFDAWQISEKQAFVSWAQELVDTVADVDLVKILDRLGKLENEASAADIDNIIAGAFVYDDFYETFFDENWFTEIGDYQDIEDILGENFVSSFASTDDIDNLLSPKY